MKTDILDILQNFFDLNGPSLYAFFQPLENIGKSCVWNEIGDIRQVKTCAIKKRIKKNLKENNFCVRMLK